MIDQLEARVTYTNPTNSANKSANKLAAMAKNQDFCQYLFPRLEHSSFDFYVYFYAFH